MASSSRYGTIPTSSSAGATSTLDFMSRAKERGRSIIATRKPWRELVNLSSFSRPLSMGEARVRILKNVAYFQINYAIVILFILFLSLLWHPISLIIFIIVMIGWCFLFFFREDQLEVFGRGIDDCLVLAVLSLITILALMFTGVFVNVIVSLAIGIAIVVIHGAFRSPDDLYDEQEAEVGGLQPVVGSERPPPSYRKV